MEITPGFGWAGTILYVDLTKKKVTKQPLSNELAYNYLGGRGINGKIVYDMVRPGTDPLGPDNVVSFGPGLLTGSIFPASRWNTTCLSSLTGIFGDGNGGGHWAPELKYAGYDHIVIQGMSDKPVYLWVDDDNVEIRDASHLWGQKLTDTTYTIRHDLNDDDIKVAAIGPAGENLVKFSCVISDLSRAPGRAGAGAVLGSKKLKAIAVRGTKGIKVADPDEVERLYGEWFDNQVTKKGLFFKAFSTYGTSLSQDRSARMGLLPVRHWQTTESTEDEIASTGANEFLKYATKSKGCFACYLHCSHFYTVNDGPYAGTCGEGAEYEALCGFGSRSGNAYLPAILHANTLVNEYGLDVVSTANVISLAYHLFQDGIITKKDTNGMNLEWGNHEEMINLIHQIANRNGFGDVLADGDVKATKKIGRESEKYVIHCKGLSPISHELRGFKGIGLTFAVSTRGADHLRGYLVVQCRPSQGKRAESFFGSKEVAIPSSYDAVAIPKAAKFYGDYKAVVDSLQICNFHSGASALGYPYMADLSKIVTAITGVKISEEHMWKCGERIWTQEAAFNWRLGLTRKDDLFSSRWHDEPLPDGPYKGETLELARFSKMLDGYYRVRGWDVTSGVATRRKLEEIGLKNVARDLKSLGKLPKNTVSIKKR